MATSKAEQKSEIVKKKIENVKLSKFGETNGICEKGIGKKVANREGNIIASIFSLFTIETQIAY